MKVIKEGVIPEREMELTCWLCGAIFQIEYTDLKDEFTHYTVKCPCCLEKSNVKEEEMPEGMILEFEHEYEIRKLAQASFTGMI